MRVNSKLEIMGYLGRSPKNRAAWRRLRQEYAEALHWLPGSHRLWAISTDLDTVDRGRSLTLAEMLRRQGTAVGKGVGRDFALERFARKIYGRSQGT